MKFFTIVFLFCFSAAATHAQSYFNIDSISPTLIDAPFLIGSKEWRNEVDQILKLQKKIDLEELDLAIAEKHFLPETVAQAVDSRLTRENFPQLYHLLDRVGETSKDVTDNFKTHWHQTRPYLADERIKMLITPSHGGSYPSGHATGSHIYSHILGLLIPQERQKFFAYAKQMSQHRILIGMHYPQDVIGGKELALLIVGGMMQNAAFQKDFRKAAREIEALENF